MLSLNTTACSILGTPIGALRRADFQNLGGVTSNAFISYDLYHPYPQTMAPLSGAQTAGSLWSKNNDRIGAKRFEAVWWRLSLGSLSRISPFRCASNMRKVQIVLYSILQPARFFMSVFIQCNFMARINRAIWSHQFLLGDRIMGAVSRSEKKNVLGQFSRNNRSTTPYWYLAKCQ